MAQETPLDATLSRMLADPEDTAARLAFHAALSDTVLYLRLDAEPAGETIAPTVIETSQGRFVLAFDLEERLAAFSGAASLHAALPGRALVRMIAGQGIGLGVNLGCAGCETLVDARTVDWLAGQFDVAPEVIANMPPEAFVAPQVDAATLRALDQRLARASGLADAAYLSSVRYPDGQAALLLAVVTSAPEVERALAGALADTVRFSADETASLDIAFFRPGDPALDRLERVAVRFDLPEPPTQDPVQRPAPGSDPDNPPRLR